MTGGNKKATHTWTNLQLKALGLFKYVMTFLLQLGIKGLNIIFINPFMDNDPLWSDTI